jgi:predicted ATPase/GAF domain-containing protein/tRNA A-37 threonylcarbamoyl transferase component Bud32
MSSGTSYTITDVIHESVTTTVYRGFRDADRSPVVIKRLKKDPPTLAEVTKLKYEYAVARDLAVPGVVEVYALEEVGTNLAIVMEDVSGRALNEVISSQTLSTREVLQIAVSIVDTLRLIHERGVIHMDIKPHNILVDTATMKCKVTDFGSSTRLTKEAQRLKSAAALEGTLGYMAPEQTGRMNRAVDRRADLYSFGVTMYEMVTGRLPFQTTDVMELVHSHIARVPAAPHAVLANTPRVLSDIIMKLLAKSPDDRYQSAHGLKSDLSECLRQLELNGKIEPFRLGRHDYVNELRIPQKIYGREPELGILLEAWERASQGEAELLLVSGYSGVGKSVLIHEIHKSIARGDGYFAAGKFDQLNRVTPYAAVVHAFRELIRTILTESSTALAIWSSKLSDAVSGNGQLLIDLIPELELVIGPQPSVPALGPTESQNRFNLTFQSFCRAIPAKDHPLVLFLDDLQWVDPASLKLVQLLLTESNIKHMLVIGAYRDNEVDASHLFALSLAELRKAGANIREVTLRPLDFPTVSRFIADTVSCDLAESEPLARIVFEKTHGNPFFMNQFLRTLHSEKLLTFDIASHAWSWDVKRIREMRVTDNVVDFMAGKIRQLPEGTQRILMLAACIGHQFDLHTLSVIHRKSRYQTARDLWEALREGYVISLDPEARFFEATLDLDVDSGSSSELNVSYRFLHDRVQQAAYSLIEDEQKKAMHLEIGRLMLERGGGEAPEGDLFAIAGHMSHGVALIQDKGERLTLARLYLRAGKKAKAGSAYEAATKYLDVGLSALDERSWETEYELTLSLHTNLAECKYLIGRFEEAEGLFNTALSRAKSALDRAQVYSLCTAFYTAWSRLADVIRCSLAGLALLGVVIPATAEERAAMLESELNEMRAGLATRSIADLAHLPVATDPEKQLTVKGLADLALASIAAEPALSPLIIAKMLTYSVKHGSADFTSCGYVVHAVLLLAKLPSYRVTSDPYVEAYEFGKVAVELLERLNTEHLRCRVQGTFASFLQLFEPIRVVIKALERARQAGLESGSLALASYMCMHIIAAKLGVGDELDLVDEEIDQNLALMQRTNELMTTLILKAAKQVVANLRGQTASLHSLDDGTFDEAAFAQQIEEMKLSVVAAWYYIHKQQLYYLYGDYRAALSLLEPIEKLIVGWSCHFFTADVTFYGCLILAALYESASPEERASYTAMIADRQAEVARWAELCPDNYAHKSFLIQAEVARISGRDMDALVLYDKAIDAARKFEFHRDAAMASEMCAKFYLSKERIRTARAYMSDAYQGYLQWGATAKMDDIMARYPHLVSKLMPLPASHDLRPSITPAGASVSSTTRLSTSILDVEAVIRAAQTIAGEVTAENVISRLMDIAIKNAGAQKGVLALERDDRLVIEASISVDQSATKPATGQPIETSSEVPVSLVQYVARTKEAMILGDVSQEARFAADPYIVARKPKSILCLAMVHQGRATGVFYLENRAANNVFTAARLELLKLLLTQAAAALENALLFERLQSRTSALHRAEEQLKVELAERERSEQARVALQEEIIRVQNARLAELSTPMIPITDRIMVMPLVGMMDSERAQRVLTAALLGVQSNRAEVVIIDITGVTLVDSDVASTLVRTAGALKLLGAQAVITGIRPEVARTLAGLEIEFGAIVTRGTLQSAIVYALDRTGNMLLSRGRTPSDRRRREDA